MKQPLLEMYLAEHASELSLVDGKTTISGALSPRVVLDVREAHEYDAVRIASAVNLSRGRLEMGIEAAVPDRQMPIILVCKSGMRARLAALTLKAMGYTSLHILKGGMDSWVSDGLPTEGGEGLTASEHVRYARHLSLPNFNVGAQLELKAKRVLVVGCGGLGSPAIAYLAAAGIGTLRLVDADRVDVSNLQRQIIHTSADIGRLKTDSAQRFVEGLNPNVHVEITSARIQQSNVRRLLEDVDLVIDGSDNLSTRYCLNDACYKTQTPYVYGAVFREEGECALFDFSNGGPCYRCLHPNPLPPSLSPSCAVSGVLGVVPGVIGLLQTNLALQYLLGEKQAGGVPLYRLKFDQLGLSKFAVTPNNACETCGHPSS